MFFVEVANVVRLGQVRLNKNTFDASIKHIHTHTFTWPFQMFLFYRKLSNCKPPQKGVKDGVLFGHLQKVCCFYSLLLLQLVGLTELFRLVRLISIKIQFSCNFIFLDLFIEWQACIKSGSILEFEWSLNVQYFRLSSKSILVVNPSSVVYLKLLMS